MFQWTKKNHLGHFDWNCLGSRYPLRPNTQNMAILAENRHLRLKLMLRGPKLWVNLILNVILVRLRLIGTHFDHNRYIIRIFIFWFFYRSLWSHAKVLDPLYRGVPEFCFHKLLFKFVVSNPFQVLEVGKKVKSKFFNLSPLPTSMAAHRCWGAKIHAQWAFLHRSKAEVSYTFYRRSRFFFVTELHHFE